LPQNVILILRLVKKVETADVECPQLAMTWFSFILILAFAITLCSSAILENIADLNKLNLKFDFIVVGGELPSPSVPVTKC
jgi:hypothetical protein